ncbi:hypothetical protein MLD52_08755 [Puniceicoccaceae bacterium K14]|nr:hypothetical protein [Puniceicoccaceae bacterium K14]
MKALQLKLLFLILLFVSQANLNGETLLGKRYIDVGYIVKAKAAVLDEGREERERNFWGENQGVRFYLDGTESIEGRGVSIEVNFPFIDEKNKQFLDLNIFAEHIDFDDTIVVRNFMEGEQLFESIEEYELEFRYGSNIVKRISVYAGLKLGWTNFLSPDFGDTEFVDSLTIGGEIRLSSTLFSHCILKIISMEHSRWGVNWPIV